MNSTRKRTAAKAAIGILVATLLFFSSGVRLPFIDDSADSYFKDSIAKAGVSYGVCRVINATVSIVKESNLELEPAGIGLSLAVGQAVDPINDMVERLSDVLVMSITSLGVQELLYEISVTLAPQLLAALLFGLSVVLWINNKKLAKFQRVLTSVSVIILIARFCLPLSSMANEFLQSQFFEQKVAEANQQLDRGTTELEELQEVTLPNYDGLLGTIENSVSYLKRKSVDYKNGVSSLLENRDTIIDNLLKLTFLYVGIFVIQVLLLPLLVFWLLMKLVNSLVLTGSLSVTVQNDLPDSKLYQDPQ